MQTNQDVFGASSQLSVNVNVGNVPEAQLGRLESVLQVGSAVSFSLSCRPVSRFSNLLQIQQNFSESRNITHISRTYLYISSARLFDRAWLVFGLSMLRTKAYRRLKVQVDVVFLLYSLSGFALGSSSVRQDVVGLDTRVDIKADFPTCATECSV